MHMHTPNLVDKHIKKIAELFPNAVTESTAGGTLHRVIDFDVLRQELSEEIVEGNQERYQFTWPGKRKSVVIANAPIAKTLRLNREKSVGRDGTSGSIDSDNIYIEGDNLDALKLLQETYLGKVKMIYIDPPYNTGSDSFIYDDDSIISNDDFSMLSGQYDEDGNMLFDIRENNEENGRFHTDWLNMMYPRLRLAKDMLSDDGVIFISIDDKELSNLILICNEVFGESNYINTISLFTKVSAGASGGGEDKRLKKNMEYVLFYAKDAQRLGALPPVYKKTKLMDYIDQMKADGKSFKYTNILYRCENKEYVKTIKDGSGGDIEIYRVNDYEIKTVKQILKDEGISEKSVYKKYFNKIMTTTNAQTSIRDRVWEATDSENNMYIATYVPVSGKDKGKKKDLIFMGKQKVLVIWLKDTADEENGELYKKEKIGTYWDGFSWINVTKEGSLRFENGKKPIALIQQLMQLVEDNNEMTLMDFFGGSASSAHAVIQENFEHNKKIKFIQVQLPEEIKPTSKKNRDYIKYLEGEGIRPVITEVGEERIRRTGKKIKEDSPEIAQKLDIGFRVFRVDSTNMKEVYYNPSEYNQTILDKYEENIKNDRISEDLLIQVMLDLGVLLSSKIEEKMIAGKKVFSVADGYLIACFDKTVTEDVVTEIAQKHPFYAVFRDSGMANDSVAVNFEQIFEMYSPNTVRKVL